MQLSIILTTDRRVNPGRSIPSSHIKRPDNVHPHRNWFTLMPGTQDPDEVEGTEILITGKQYVLFNRRYDLGAGYGIVAKLTPDMQVTPLLRRAVGKEVDVIKDKNNFGINGLWPILEQVWTDEPEETSEFVETAIEYRNDVEEFARDESTLEELEQAMLDSEAYLEREDETNND